MKTIAFHICFSAVLLPGILYGQIDTLSLGSDSLFSIAKIKAFDGQREYARYLCREVLKKSPSYSEVRILIGRTLAWDGRKQEARAEFQSILSQSPDNREAAIALLDLEYWDDRNAEAVVIADSALAYSRDNQELLFRKARALAQIQRDEEALEILSSLYQRDPKNAAIGDLRRSIALQSSKYTVGIDYSYDKYSRTFDPMEYASISVGRRTPIGSLSARINYSNRFGKDGYQTEIDFYPGIAPGMYGYLSYGYSGSGLFPLHRFGAEFFTSFPASFEGSIGTRYLYFDAASTVLIYTGAVGWYFSDYWFSLRTYITPWEYSNGTIDVSRSLNLTIRYYFPNPENYISVRGGGGFSPDQRKVQTNIGISGIEIFLLKSQSVYAAWQQSISTFTFFIISADYSHQELSFSPGNYVDIYSVSAGFRVKL